MRTSLEYNFAASGRIGHLWALHPSRKGGIVLFLPPQLLQLVRSDRHAVVLLLHELIELGRGLRRLARQELAELGPIGKVGAVREGGIAHGPVVPVPVQLLVAPQHAVGRVQAEPSPLGPFVPSLPLASRLAPPVQRGRLQRGQDSGGLDQIGRQVGAVLEEILLQLSPPQFGLLWVVELGPSLWAVGAAAHVFVFAAADQNVVAFLVAIVIAIFWWLG